MLMVSRERCGTWVREEESVAEESADLPANRARNTDSGIQVKRRDNSSRGRRAANSFDGEETLSVIV